MKTRFAAIAGIASLLLASVSSAFAASNGALTSLTASATTVTVGQEVSFTVLGTIKPGTKGCRISGGKAGSYSDMGVFTSFPAVMPKKFSFDKAGTYYVHMYGGTADTEHVCDGNLNVKITVMDKPKPMVMPGAQVGPVSPMAANIQFQMPGVCPPAPYHKIPENSDDATGKLRCIQPNPSCPEGWKQGAFDSNIGRLTCVPAVEPKCPAGFSGGMQNGSLVCTAHMPQPKIACPKATPANKWGTTYYAESWNVVGCSVNLEPPK